MAVLTLGPSERPVDIVLSHANGFNGRTYRTILQPLAADLRILALDLRGARGPFWLLDGRDLQSAGRGGRG